MADPTYKSSDVAAEIQALAEANMASLGLKYVHYGDEETIPDVPALIIEPGRKTRDWAGTSMQTTNEFEVFMLLYHTTSDENDKTRQELDTITEAWEELLNTTAAPTQYGGTKLNGRLVRGIVTRIEFGYASKRDAKMQANYMTFSGMSKTRLVNP